MGDTLTRGFADLLARVDGPLHFRIFLQPAVAIVYAIIDGIKDSRKGRLPYFWSLFTERGHRMELVRRGWKSVGKIFILALVLDAAYQFIALKRFYVGEAVLVAVILAIVPYLLLRGFVNRIMALGN